MKSDSFRLALPVLAALAFSPLVSGFTFIFSATKRPVKWTPDTTVVSVQIMADNSATLSDGSTRATCIRAAMNDAQRGWNQYLGDVQFSPQIVPAGAGGADGNGINEIFFSSKPYNKSWDTNTLAVTTVWLSGNQRKEADLIFNTAYKWDSYRGPLHANSTYDLQRVALHELGHMLGLDHPDGATPPQTVAAIMNSVVSNIDSLTGDDIAGAQKLYGAAPLGSVPANDNFASATPITLSGTSAQVTGTNVNASREPGEPMHSGESGGHSVWWKWTAPAAGSVSVDTQGSLFDTTIGVYTGTSVTQLSDVGFDDEKEDGVMPSSGLTFKVTAGTTYYFAVDGFNSDDGFGADSAAITLNLNFAATGGTAPAITGQPVSEAVPPGGSVTFSVTATGAALSYQWALNGTAISGAVNPTLTLSNVQVASTGNYTVTVSNAGGSVTSHQATLTLATALPNQTVTTGHNATFTAVGAVGSVQWQVLSTNSGSAWTNLGDGGVYGGSATGTLEITGATSALNGFEYRYVATSSGNVSTSNAVTLSVSPALLPSPVCLAVNGAGAVIVGDTSTDTVQSVGSSGSVSLLAGATLQAGSADGKGAAAQFNNPGGIAYASDGNLYVADTANGTIRRIAADGTVTTLAGSTTIRGNADGSGGSASFNNPGGIAAFGGTLYVADVMNNTVRQITTAGAVTTLAGGAGQTGSSDGAGSTARFNRPTGVAVDGSGNVCVTDSNNNTVRKITPAGMVTTLAGLAGVSGSQDGTGNGASFNNPTGIALDASGNLYVADTGNSCIRRITPAGVVTTLAGLPTIAGLEDGADSALFNQPHGLAFDAGNNLYVADTGNAAIRKITLAGAVTTLTLTAAATPTPTPTPSSTPTPTPTPPAAPSSGGGGSLDGWLVSALGLIFFLRWSFGKN